MNSPTHARFQHRIARKPRSVVMQGTGFCNAACTYCYLPNKDDKTPMSLEVAKAVAAAIAALDHSDGSPVNVVWHAGEPMALGTKRMADLLEPFRGLMNAGAVRHGMQTNAMLVSERWLSLIHEHRIDVGVSIDGPEHLCTQRVDRNGRPIFRRVMRGIERLRDGGVPFSVIAVVTGESVKRPVELLDFLASLGPWNIGLSIEEAEGANLGRPQPTREDAQAFWTETINWVRRQGPRGVQVREVNRLGQFLKATPKERAQRREQYRVDPLPTVATNGDVVLLSPELAGISSDTYGDFLAGNVLQKDLQSIIGDGHELRYVREFLESLDYCKAKCTFYDFCLGSQAGNRFFEHGSFVPSETRFCQVTEMALIEALNTTIKKEKSA
ncbi:cyclophane-forming radical SAM peptide maturase AmcB [Kitasatospora sp. NPDC059408]|uniref:cyclophane-forming radical SAM peptide maturase AmcB n=1 Tax=Kitasatospora sp. NPDC059408 TaxID=3346823 RepID=UPI00369D85F3